MYASQLEERELFRYPPLFRLIEIRLKHRNETVVRDFSNEYAETLRKKLGDRVIGPDKPAVGKVQNLYIRILLLKIESSASSSLLRDMLEKIQVQALSNAVFRHTIVQYDVDPV
jgi:primosomal protein N' (replication factor Y)